MSLPYYLPLIATCKLIIDTQGVIVTRRKGGKEEGWKGGRKKLPYILSHMEEPKQCSTLELLLVSTSNAQVGRNVMNITELRPHLLRFRGLTGLP